MGKDSYFFSQTRPNDLVERLRWRAAQYATGPATYADLKAAATEIERLRALLKENEEAPSNRDEAPE